VLAGLCEAEQRERRFADAMQRGIPLFSEGFRVLLDHYRREPRKLSEVMWHAQRTLASGSAFSAWTGYEPALEVENGQFRAAPVPWSGLEEHRAQIARQLPAVGAIQVETPDGLSHATGFLVAPDLVLTVNHAVEKGMQDGAATMALRKGARIWFTTAENAKDAGPDRRIAWPQAIDREARLALLRLEGPIQNAQPLAIVALGKQPALGRRIYLIGYPFLQTDLDPALVAHVFGPHLGSKRVQPGYVIAAPAGHWGFDHDAFTLGGSGGSPVIDLDSGSVLGVHWGGMNQANFRRGRASGLWKEQNRGILRAAGVIADQATA
jgi:V8-like Glu-specific endopeptidase